MTLCAGAACQERKSGACVDTAAGTCYVAPSEYECTRTATFIETETCEGQCDGGDCLSQLPLTCFTCSGAGATCIEAAEACPEGSSLFKKSSVTVESGDSVSATCANIALWAQAVCETPALISCNVDGDIPDACASLESAPSESATDAATDSSAESGSSDASTPVDASID